MSDQKLDLCVFFVDVVGSVNIYETLGDDFAKSIIIDQCLPRLIEITRKQRGSIIKTTGDGMLCTFASADDALNAGLEMQEMVAGGLRYAPGAPPVSLLLKVGIHYGTVITESNDIYGDAVNVAARIDDIADGNQVIMTRRCYDLLSTQCQEMVEPIGKVSVKGKIQPIEIFQLKWEKSPLVAVENQTVKPVDPSNEDLSESTILEDDDGTLLEDSEEFDSTILVDDVVAMEHRLQLIFENNQIVAGTQRPKVLLGRSSQNDITINNRKTSRQHALIEFRGDQFVLVDDSSNGTYVLPENSKSPEHIQKAEFLLDGKGAIYLSGLPLNAAEAIRYEVQS